MKSITFNPYIVGNPIKSKEMFFGREDDFQFTVKKIGEGRANQIVVLCGERRSGKTSILFQILGGRLGPAFLPVLIDMQMLAGIKGDLELFRAILRAGCAALDMKPHEVEELEKTAGSASVERLFESFLEYARRRAPDKIILFLLDEYELIEAKIRDGSLSESTVHYLAGILESPFRVSFIFTGSTNLEDRKTEVWKSLLAKSIYRKISYLSRNDTCRLITDPLKDVVSYSDEMLESVYRLTGGQPFYTQVICQNMVDLLMESGKNAPEPADLDRIVRDIVDNPLPQMIYSWNSVSEWDQIIMASLASRLTETDTWADAAEVVRFIRDNRIVLPFKKERANVLLEEAYHKEFLEKNESDSYRFKMDLFRKWIRREHSIWKAAKEAGLEFQKSLKPLFITAAAVICAAGLGFFAWKVLVPLIRPAAEPQPAAGQASETPGENAGAVREVAFTANRGPFRLQIDGKQTLTSEGQPNPRLITVPSMEPGVHELIAVLVGGEKKTFSADVSAESRTFSIEFLKPAAKSATAAASPAETTAETQAAEPAVETDQSVAVGFLILNSQPPGADVMVDGLNTGRKTPYAESVASGEHTISLSMDGYRARTETIEVRKDSRTASDFTLEAVWGEIVFDVRPTAKIYLDGKHILDTPYAKPFTAQAGRHEITIENEALGIKKNRWIEVKEGETVSVQEVLKQP